MKIDWLALIADKSVPLSRYEKEANRWDTCAFGEVIDRTDVDILRSVWSAQPRDKKLLSWGSRFTRSVSKNRRKAALACYLAIQERVVHLVLSRRTKQKGGKP